MKEGNRDVHPSVAAPPRLMTLEEFLDYGEPGVRYELVEGVPVEMPQPNKRRQLIVLGLAVRLMRWIGERRLPYAVTLPGVQTSQHTLRVPDITVCRREDAAAGVEGDEAGMVRLGVPVALVVEVTSENRREDYGRKREEYARRGVEAYVIVDCGGGGVWWCAGSRTLRLGGTVGRRRIGRGRRRCWRRWVGASRR